MSQNILKIDFDVAQALVNYVDRNKAHPSLAWGIATATDVRNKLCELKDDSGLIETTVFNQWLSGQSSGKMAGGCDKHLNHLMQLVRRASKA